MTVMFASTTEPMPERPIREYVQKIRSYFANLVSDAGGSIADWEDVANCINFVDKCREKDWLNDDAEPMIAEAERCMREVSDHYREHGCIHLVEKNRQPVLNLLDDYETMMRMMSARNYVEAFNAFARDVYEAKQRKRTSGVTAIEFVR
jgi:hypothetical protein